MRYISVEEFLMGRAKLEDLSPELLGNTNTLVPRVNELLSHFGEYRACTSGYRSPKDQARINPKATHSAHLSCEAIDLQDKDGELKKFCVNNIKLLEEIGLWMEIGSSTPNWCHLQIRPTKRRIFIP